MAYQAQQRRADFYGWGRTAAAGVLSRLRTVPKPQRADAIRRTLAAIDPGLAARAESSALDEMRTTGAPADVALERGLANAMTQGLIAELERVGKGERIKPRSLLGLGSFMSQVTTSIAANQAASASGGVRCVGYSWTGTQWTRTASGKADIPGPSGAGCPSTTQAVSGGVTTTGTVAPVPKIENLYLQLGPLFFPLAMLTTIDVGWGSNNPKGLRYRFTDPKAIAAMPDVWKKEFAAALTSPDGEWNTAAFQKWGSGALIPFFTAMGINVDATPIRGTFSTWGGISGSNPKELLRRDPLFVFKHPLYNQDWGLYMALSCGTIGPNPNQPKQSAYLNATCLDFLVLPLPPDRSTWFGRWVGRIVDRVDGAIHDALDFVSNTVCALVNQPGAAASATSTSVAAGAGVAAAQQFLCAPPPPPPPQVQGSGWLVPIAILAGGGLLVFALSQR